MAINMAASAITLIAFRSIMRDSLAGAKLPRHQLRVNGIRSRFCRAPFCGAPTDEALQLVIGGTPR
jgi:hypothetical protein